MNKYYCLGHECSVKQTCIRYTEEISLRDSEETKACFMRKCTSQKRYMQDETKIVKGR